MELSQRRGEDRMKTIMKKMNSIVVFCILFFLIISPVNAETGTTESPEVDIMTSPEKVLFDLQNLKPGDWSERTIVIRNSGKQDFNYIASGKRKSGSQDFYNALQLKVEDANGVLYEGNMSEFDKLDARPISTGKNEELKFTVKVPDELGNLYMGLSTEVEFKFYAEGTLGGLLPVDGPKLPSTSSGIYNVLLAGGLLVGGGSLLMMVRKKLKFKNDM